MAPHLVLIALTLIALRKLNHFFLFWPHVDLWLTRLGTLMERALTLTLAWGALTLTLGLERALTLTLGMERALGWPWPPLNRDLTLRQSNWFSHFLKILKLCAMSSGCISCCSLRCFPTADPRLKSLTMSSGTLYRQSFTSICRSVTNWLYFFFS